MFPPENASGALLETMVSDLVPAVDRTVRILKSFKSAQDQLGVSELSRSLDMNKSTVHKIALTLCHHGFLHRSESSKKYRLGYALLELGNLMMDGVNLRAVARPFLRGLVVATGQTAILSVLDGDRVMIVDREESHEDIKITAPIGRRIPACAGSSGKVLLTEEDVDRIFGPKGLPLFAKNSIVDAAAYKREIARAREAGYALDEEEYIEGARAVSVPVFDSSQTVVAAVTLVGFASKMPKDRAQFFIEQTMRSAVEISRRLGAGNRD